MESGLSASDVALMSRNADGFGNGNNFLWIFALLILVGGGRFGGFNGNGDFNQFATAASQSEILLGQQFQGLDNKIDRLGQGIADATFNLNNSIKDGNYALGNSIAECCCKTQRAIDGVNFNIATQSAAIQANDTANTQKILDVICGNRMAEMQSQINQLQLQAAMCGVMRYPNTVTYNAGPYPPAITPQI